MSSACSILASVGMSTLDVASSRISRCGFASSARANATSWRWPIESRRAALLDLRRRSPFGSSRDEPVRSHRAWPRPRRPRTIASGRPNAMLSRTEPANRNASCGTIPSWRRSERTVHVAQVVAVDQDRARRWGRRSAPAASRCVDLPAPVWPTSATVCPASTAKEMPCSTSAVSSR